MMDEILPQKIDESRLSREDRDRELRWIETTGQRKGGTKMFL
jgi:hypothetical protein